MTASFITTPIYYINAQPHIGHAYTTMLADAIARSRRLMGEDVFFLTGTDEHGQKVARAAQKAGQDTKKFADEVSSAFRKMGADLSISNDDFIRTTEPRHYAAAHEIWNRVQKAGDIYKGEYEGWYCSVDELFVPEAQLVDDKCPTCGSKVERLKEESYYFRLSKYQQPLLDWYRDHPDFVQPEFRLNEVRTFVEAGFNVICDKPLTTTLDEAHALAQLVERTGLVFAVTYNYSGYPLVRHAKQLFRSGEMGVVRKVLVEYLQGWLVLPEENRGSKQAAWRTNPAESGVGGAIGDIGTHALHLVEYITCDPVVELCADKSTFLPGRTLDEDVNALLRKISHEELRTAQGNTHVATCCLQRSHERRPGTWRRKNNKVAAGGICIEVADD